MFAVIVKHQGKKHDVEVDPTSNGETFKYQLFSITGVEPDRQKIIVKGGQLKDDADMSKLGLKPKQVLMMMGTPSADAQVIEKPKEKVKFLEDMDEAEAAQLEGATPAGLVNLGNTCYMNSTLQALRSITELEDELFRYGRNEYALSQIHHYHNGRLTVRQCHRRRWAVQRYTSTGIQPVGPWCYRCYRRRSRRHLFPPRSLQANVRDPEGLPSTRVSKQPPDRLPTVRTKVKGRKWLRAAGCGRGLVTDRLPAAD